MKIKSEERPKNEPPLNCGGHEWRAAPRSPGDDNQSCLGDQPGPNMEAWWFAMVPENRAFKWLRFHLGSECWGSDWCLSGWDTLLLVSCWSKAIRKCPLGPENDSLWWHNIPFPWSNRIRLFWWAEWVMFHSRGFIYTCYFSWESSWNGFFPSLPGPASSCGADSEAWRQFWGGTLPKASRVVRLGADADSQWKCWMFFRRNDCTSSSETMVEVERKFESDLQSGSASCWFNGSIVISLTPL